MSPARTPKKKIWLTLTECVAATQKLDPLGQGHNFETLLRACSDCKLKATFSMRRNLLLVTESDLRAWLNCLDGEPIKKKTRKRKPKESS